MREVILQKGFLSLEHYPDGSLIFKDSTFDPPEIAKFKDPYAAYDWLMNDATEFYISPNGKAFLESARKLIGEMN